MALLRNKVIQDESNKNHLFFWGVGIFQVYRRKLWMSFCEDTGPIKEESAGWREASVKPICQLGPGALTKGTGTDPPLPCGKARPRT